MPADIFFKLDDIKGDSKDKKHKNEIEVYAYSLGVTQTSTIGSTTGHGQGKVKFNEFHIVKPTDSSTSKLMQAVSTGQHFKKGTLVVRKAGGDQQEYLTYTLTNPFVTSVQSSSGPAGTLTDEMVSLDCEEIKIEYGAQNADGSIGGKVQGGYNFAKQKKP